MRIFHITSPSRAVAIVDSGIFYPVTDHPLNNDNGLNCFCYRAGYRMGQCFEGEGAKLILEWSDPVAITHPDTSPPLQTDVLHDQHPWRCFIRGGSAPNLLRVVGIQFAKDAVDSLIEIPAWHSWLPASPRNSLRRRLRLDFLRSLRGKYSSKALHLSVVG